MSSFEQMKDSLFATDETVDARRVHCDPCDRNFHGICAECGCPLLSKLRLNRSTCPIGKWVAVVQEPKP